MIANLPISTQLGGPPTIPPSYIRVHAVVWECSEGQTDTQTGVANIHFASAVRNVISGRGVYRLDAVAVIQPTVSVD